MSRERGGGWRLPLRLAWRDARRARGRSLLVLLMIALPVWAVTVADTVYGTAQVSGAEGATRTLGAAQALVTPIGGGRVVQLPDPRQSMTTLGGRRDGRPDLEEVLAALGASGAPTTALREGGVVYATDRGRDDAQVLLVDLADPLAAGLVSLEQGRVPRSTDEVVVNATVAERGPGLGEDLALADGSTRRVVGLAESASFTGRPFVSGLPGSVPLRYSAPAFLVGGDAVDWDQVRAANEVGASVLSRAVLADPPPDSELPPELGASGEGAMSAETLTVLALVVVMVLIEVVLLAGPAFAVGARRQARSLALLSAAGGSPRDTRRTVLASGVVLGSLAAVLGAGLGLVSAWVAMPLVQRPFDETFGPFDPAPLHVAAVAALGLLSALLASAVPAWIASRQDVVAVLAGRRGDAKASRRSPVLGLVLLGAGVALAVAGARRDGGELLVAASAIVCVLGMLLLVAVVVAVVSRSARRLPLSLRFAARDAARHRTRTVPAVAAVAATVAGVVALGVAVSSDEAQNEAQYTPLAQPGGAVVSLQSEDRTGRGATAQQVETVLRRTLPDAALSPVQGVGGRSGYAARVRVGLPGDRQPLVGWSGGLAGDLLVSSGALPAVVVGDYTDEERARAARVLADGGAVVFTDHGARGDEARLVRTPGRGQRDQRDQPVPGPEVVRVPAVVLDVPPVQATVRAVVSPEVAGRLGLEPRTSAIAVDAATTAAERQDAAEAVRALPGPATLYVERGYQPPPETRIVLLVLVGLAGVLMLGGTLTATFLALADARPDLATLSAVGASRRTRRAVAASYALVVGLVGAVLGTLVGLVPGIAISFPLTRPFDAGAGVLSGPSHHLALPWPLIGAVVLGLPLLTALVVALTARSRLPLAARLD